MWFDDENPRQLNEYVALQTTTRGVYSLTGDPIHELLRYTGGSCYDNPVFSRRKIHGVRGVVRHSRGERGRKRKRRGKRRRKRKDKENTQF